MGKNSYTDEFKKQIVMLYQNWKSIVEIIKECGVSKSAVYQWIENFNNSGSFKAKDNQSNEENELIYLRK
ncbi:helix-turn-helix domain-containing protein [Spiroplasma endosymbiont of Agriotes lineatus]|uniref:helix-turn-helix domain-containing protein n=1 Tax=Spiroplasma endosymbiont of Agriotes lineatus TaxID=3077930 RepID=UPI0030CD07CB